MRTTIYAIIIAILTINPVWAESECSIKDSLMERECVPSQLDPFRNYETRVPRDSQFIMIATERYKECIILMREDFPSYDRGQHLPNYFLTNHEFCMDLSFRIMHYLYNLE